MSSASAPFIFLNLFALWLLILVYCFHVFPLAYIFNCRMLLVSLNLLQLAFDVFGYVS